MGRFPLIAPGVEMGASARPRATSHFDRVLSPLTARETQGGFSLSRNGFQESASRLASSKCPSSKSLPTHLKYSQKNDASGNPYARSPGTHKSNFWAEINADMIAGLRSRTLSGHPDDSIRVSMLSERLRNL